MSRFVSLVSVILAGTLAASAAAEPRVSNRTPRPNEVGYHPADGETLRLNPPSLIWLHEPAAVTYEVQRARAAESADKIPWNTYTHRVPLAAGE